VKPAWSWKFEPGALAAVVVDLPSRITREWAWGGGTGAGVRVGIIDSGVDASHPRVGSVAGGAAFEYDPRAPSRVRVLEGEFQDVQGHGTACASIVRIAAPEAEIYGIRVLGRKLKGKGFVFAAGLRWAIDRGLQVVNMSLSTSSARHYAVFHRLVDEAAFRRMMLVCAINNFPGPSFPSQYSGVFSVASHRGKDPFAFDVNPEPPAEWGAPGLDLEVAWLGGRTITATGNSFAAPHIAGLIARILSKHPGLTPFQMKTILSALASNARVSASGG
jgi:subtilisin family serine protease